MLKMRFLRQHVLDGVTFTMKIESPELLPGKSHFY